MGGAAAGYLESLRDRAVVDRVQPLGGDRYSLSVPAASPESMLSALLAHGVQIVAVNPVRDTLEDLFVQKVAESPGARGLEVPQPCE